MGESWMGRILSLFFVLTLGSVTDYSVTVRDEASGSSTSDTTSNTGSLVINSLQCCASYTYQVSARNGAGRGSPSQSMSFNTNVDFNGEYAVYKP